MHRRRSDLRSPTCVYCRWRVPRSCDRWACSLTWTRDRCPSTTWSRAQRSTASQDPQSSQRGCFPCWGPETKTSPSSSWPRSTSWPDGRRDRQDDNIFTEFIVTKSGFYICRINWNSKILSIINWLSIMAQRKLQKSTCLMLAVMTGSSSSPISQGWWRLFVSKLLIKDKCHKWCSFERLDKTIDSLTPLGSQHGDSWADQIFVV